MNTINRSAPARTDSGPARSRGTAVMVPALLAALVATMLLAVPRVADAASDFDNVDQVLVGTFVDAGVAISSGNYDPATTDAVVLATDANFPDGLTASAVAARVGGPVLFTDPTTISRPSLDEIDRLLDEGDTIYVMGGQAAIANSVTDALQPTYVVQRVSGETRLETATAAADLVGVPASGLVIIARAFGPDGANTPADRTTGWVDAISCGAYAAANNIPILLTETDQLSATTEQALRDGGATTAIICGGTAAVSQATATAIGGIVDTVVRIDGATRVETAVSAAIDLFDLPTAAGNDYTVINGYGENFGFGLAAAPLGDPILLVGTTEPTDCDDASQPSRETLCYLQTGTDATPADILLIGNEAIIRDVVSNAVGEAAGGESQATPTPTPTSTQDPTQFPALAAPDDVDATDDTNDNGTRLTITWDAASDPNDILAGYNVYIDGTRVGDTNPTVDADQTSYIARGLTAEEAVTVTVTAVDTAGRESAMSASSTATPTDEVPARLAEFEADARNSAVALTWNIGPVDHQLYTLSRGDTTLQGGCPAAGEYAEIETIEDRDTLSYTDDTATNGNSYCYRISVTDDADQRGADAEDGPVTPNTGQPVVTIDYPSGDTSPAPGDQPDTIYYGAPVVVRFTVTDSDNQPSDLTATWELSYVEDTAYVTIADDIPIDFEDDDDDGQATFTIPSCAVGDTTSTTCIRDDNDDDVRIRVTVDDGQVSRRVSSGDVTLTRNPPPVTGLAAIGVQGAVELTFDRIDAPPAIIPQYVISRAQVTVAPDSDASDEACPDPGSPMYQELDETVVQPASGATVTFTDSNGLDADGEQAGGQQIADYLYCYLVQAERANGLTGPADLSSGNPLVAPGLGSSITSPRNNGQLDRGEVETIGYRLSIPNGASDVVVKLFYCLDYRAALPGASPACQDAGGFTEITAANGLQGTPPTADGANSVGWNVPTGQATAQGDNETGAIEIRVSADGAGGDTSRVTGIIFA